MHKPQLNSPTPEHCELFSTCKKLCLIEILSSNELLHEALNYYIKQ